jgi:molecular chaperone GrpE (heat shock protein)
MSDEPLGSPKAGPSSPAADQHTLGFSTIYRLCQEVISLRERNNRQHQEFERRLNNIRDELKDQFNSFAADTQRAYQRMREEFHGEKRISLALLNELLEINQDLETIVAACPSGEDLEAMRRWSEAVRVESRKVQAALLRHGIHPYDAILSSPYNPALHERVGSKRVEGMGPLLIAEQREHGYASKQPEFVLRRPKVIVSE